jgi:hypothetical protein
VLALSVRVRRSFPPRRPDKIRCRASTITDSEFARPAGTLRSQPPRRSGHPATGESTAKLCGEGVAKKRGGSAGKGSERSTPRDESDAGPAVSGGACAGFWRGIKEAAASLVSRRLATRAPTTTDLSLSHPPFSLSLLHSRCPPHARPPPPRAPRRWRSPVPATTTPARARTRPRRTRPRARPRRRRRSAPSAPARPLPARARRRRS